MWKELSPHVATKDYRLYNLIDPVVKPVAMTLAEIDSAIVDCYRSFYMQKGHQLLKLKSGPRREYANRSMKLIMGSSFIRKKMLSGVTHDMKEILRKLGHSEDDFKVATADLPEPAPEAPGLKAV